MSQNHRQALSRVLWIGGATDSGKTTVTRLIAKRHGIRVYDYDGRDLPQVERLARTSARYRTFLAASLDENWVQPEPDDLFQFTLQAFRDRFPLVIGELVALSEDCVVVAEGHGLIPELVAPLLASKRQAIWLVPTPEFKRASMERRNKPSFRDRVGDPARAMSNVYARDMLLADHISAQARARDLALYHVDGSLTAEEVAAMVEQHFGPCLRRA
jgi:shikimate kinase